MKQKALRTYLNSSYSNISSLNKYLDEGWYVKLVTPIGDYLEYILEKK